MISIINSICLIFIHVPTHTRQKQLAQLSKVVRISFLFLLFNLHTHTHTYLQNRSVISMKNWSMLPVECISHIISLTSPGDACRSSLVSTVFREAADSDFVWRSFLPQDINQIISKSLFPSQSSLNSISIKDLYFHLRIHHQHIILDGNMVLTCNIYYLFFIRSQLIN